MPVSDPLKKQIAQKARLHMITLMVQAIIQLKIKNLLRLDFQDLEFLERRNKILLITF